MNRLIRYSLPLLLNFFSFCVSINAHAEVAQSMETFATQANKATVYIYRDSLKGLFRGFLTRIDGIDAVNLRPYTYIKFELEPGAYVLSAELDKNPNGIKIAVEAGKNYFVQTKPVIDFFPPPTPKVQLVDEAAGKEGVLECKLTEVFDSSTVALNKLGVSIPNLNQIVATNTRVISDQKSDKAKAKEEAERARAEKMAQAQAKIDAWKQQQQQKGG